jgi:hypothetical protein
MGWEASTETQRPARVDAENGGCPSGWRGGAHALVLASGTPCSGPASFSGNDSCRCDPKRKLFPPILKFVTVAVPAGAQRAEFAPGLTSLISS